MATDHTDLFRFFVHRGVQLSDPVSARRWVVVAFPDGMTAADRQLLQGRNYAAYRRSPEYRGTLSSAMLTALDESLRVINEQLDIADLTMTIEHALRKPSLTSFVSTKVFRAWWGRVARALLVSTYDPTAALDDPDRVAFARQLQLLGMLERLAARDLVDARQVRDFLTYAIVVLPKKALVRNGDFPGPDSPTRPERAETPPPLTRKPPVVDPDRLVDAIDDVRNAVGLVARRRTVQPYGDSRPEPFVLSSVPASYLAERTKRVITDVVLHSQRLTLPDIANALEKELAKSGALDPYARAGAVKPLSSTSSTGSTAVSAQALTAGAPGGLQGLARVPGIADLKVVRKRLLRYEDGEIALIENIMAKESRSRQHRLLHRDTDVTTTQSETEKVTERDTQVAERFELEQESSNTISSDSKVEAGLTVTASYGTFLSATANAGFSSSTAQTHANRSASKYARDVVDRSASKVRELVQTFQSHIALTETEEINRHGFDNETSDHVVGIYRWVDKVLEAQVFNYGKRLMLEVMVPDPARYYRQRVASAALPGVTRAMPPPLEVADASVARGVRPLAPSDITMSNYLAYAAIYGAVDVEPPPPLYRWVADAWKEEKGQDPWAVMSARKEIEVDPGYAPVFYRAALVYPKRAIRLKADPDAGAADSTLVISAEMETMATISVGGAESLLGAGGGVVAGSPLSALTSYPTDKVGVAVMVERQTSYACEISVLCSRSVEEYVRWQTSIYGSVLRAFESRRSEYETQVTAAKNAHVQTFAVRPSAENETTIRTELKRAALTLLQQQQPPFVYDAIGSDRPPTISLDASVNASRIQFFEQACEWNQIVYVPYGYYWASPNDWDDLADQWDSDDQMREFLRAGWARVVIPVRPAFTSAICLYLSTGILWSGDQVPQVDDPLFVSAVQEIQEADETADGLADSDPWIVTLPTALTHLQPGPGLPVLVAP